MISESSTANSGPCAFSVFDPEALDAQLRGSGVDAAVARRVRINFFKKGLAIDRCLEPIPMAARAGIVRSVMLQEITLVRSVDSLIDGATKLIFKTAGGYAIEAVILRAATGRVSLCISSQVGCAAACRFCATGKMGIAKNLGEGEILDQLVQANRILRSENQRVRNVVFMGMGEPLHNPEALHASLGALLNSRLFDHPAKRVLVSTVGVPDELVATAERFPGVNYAISLHSVSQKIRESIIPLAKKHPLEQLHDAIAELNRIQSPQKEVMIEYLMLDGINDQEGYARDLVAWSRDLRLHLNLIPYNPIEGEPQLKGSPRDRIEAFAAVTKRANIPTTIRYSMGADIAAACGQLVRRENRMVAR